MLSSNELIAFLSNESALVRDHALRSLALGGEHSGATADHAVAVIERMGGGAFWNLERVAGLPLTTKTLATAIGWLALAGCPGWVREWVIGAPQALVVANADPVRGVRDSCVRDRLVGRLEMQRLAPEELWARLDQVLPGTDQSHDLLRVLAQHDEFVMARISGLLTKRDHALHLAAIELAGLTHLGTMVPLLVDALEAESAVWRDAGIEALARIGTAGAVTTIEQRCARGSAAFRLAAADCLGRFRVPSVEGAILRSLAEEDDAAVRGRLYQGLADICATSGFEAMYAAAKDAKSTEARDLRSSVAALARMLKRTIPESAIWEQQAARSGSSFLQHLKASPKPIPAEASVPAVFGGGFPSAETDEELSVPASSARQPIRRDESKVGRNDPCPCGSGKKYKKCCGT